MKGITVAELIEQLKKLPQDMMVIREEVSDSGWREDVGVTEVVIEPLYDSPAYHEYCYSKDKVMTSKTHCVTLY